MIVAGAGVSSARAQTAQPTTSPPPSQSLVLVNQIQNLRDQMQQMQGQIEVLQHKLQQLQQTSKEQYVDLDSRVGKLEHAQAAPAESPPPVSSIPAAEVASVSTAGPMPASEKVAAQSDFDAAFKSLRAGNYVDSARSFRAFIGKYPDSPLVSNAYYWLGGSYYVTRNYKPALAAFQTLLEKYPGSGKASEAQLRLADCQIALKDYVAARATLQAVIKAHPGTPLEKRARDRMQDIPAATSAK
ncbi:MAG TPA: tol-pal system protein YbgF [Rhodanobacteraceae bacterium]|nr:tol-pal system protein YbgF [Rhodanobacteraceae bacterium]